MGLLEDVMKALERVPGWKRIATAPAEIDALSKRVAALERGWPRQAATAARGVGA